MEVGKVIKIYKKELEAPFLLNSSFQVFSVNFKKFTLQNLNFFYFLIPFSVNSGGN